MIEESGEKNRYAPKWTELFSHQHIHRVSWKSEVVFRFILLTTQPTGCGQGHNYLGEGKIKMH